MEGWIHIKDLCRPSSTTPGATYVTLGWPIMKHRLSVSPLDFGVHAVFYMLIIFIDQHITLMQLTCEGDSTVSYNWIDIWFYWKIIRNRFGGWLMVYVHKAPPIENGLTTQGRPSYRKGEWFDSNPVVPQSGTNCPARLSRILGWCELHWWHLHVSMWCWITRVMLTAPSTLYVQTSICASNKCLSKIFWIVINFIFYLNFNLSKTVVFQVLGCCTVIGHKTMGPYPHTPMVIRLDNFLLKYVGYIIQTSKNRNF